MLLQISIALLIGAVGSYRGFFLPKLLSESIEELSASQSKWVASVISVCISLLFIWKTNPVETGEWVEYAFLITLYFIAAIDLYSKIIPNKLVLVLLGIALIALFPGFEKELILAFGIISLSLVLFNLLISRIFKKVALGWGDVKLISALSLYVGWEVIWVIYIAIILGGLLSIIGILLKKIDRSTRVPLAIFFLLGYLLLSLIDLKAFFILD